MKNTPNIIQINNSAPQISAENDAPSAILLIFFLRKLKVQKIFLIPYQTQEVEKSLILLNRSFNLPWPLSFFG